MVALTSWYSLVSGTSRVVHARGLGNTVLRGRGPRQAHYDGAIIQFSRVPTAGQPNARTTPACTTSDILGPMVSSAVCQRLVLTACQPGQGRASARRARAGFLTYTIWILCSIKSTSRQRRKSQKMLRIILKKL